MFCDSFIIEYLSSTNNTKFAQAYFLIVILEQKKLFPHQMVETIWGDFIYERATSCVQIVFKARTLRFVDTVDQTLHDVLKIIFVVYRRIRWKCAHTLTEPFRYLAIDATLDRVGTYTIVAKNVVYYEKLKQCRRKRFVPAVYRTEHCVDSVTLLIPVQLIELMLRYSGSEISAILLRHSEDVLRGAACIS